MKNFRSNGLLTLKCVLLFQMSKQSYPSLNMFVFVDSVVFILFLNLSCLES